eukprot:m.339400 g.339400  ORF g.339400 m.339400 type:complete len:55 (+) comp18789_c0_seq1:1624-1788(+)
MVYNAGNQSRDIERSQIEILFSGCQTLLRNLADVSSATIGVLLIQEAKNYHALI